MGEQNTRPLASATHSVVLTRRGMVCSASPLAATAGIGVLQEGGNAFDAAIAVAAAEAVTLSPMCGLGGEVFALLYQSSTGNLYGVSGSGRAPMAATREDFVSRGHDKMPLEGPLSASVPGEVHAWQTVLDRFGTRPLGSLLEPAIGLAEEGYPIPQRIGLLYSQHFSKILRFPTTAAIFTRSGNPLLSGDVLVQKDLARSLRRIAQGGPEEFYRGGLARELVEAIRGAGGLFSPEDLAGQTTRVYEAPPSISYRGHAIYATAPPSQGFLVLEMLNILEGFDLAGMGHNSADTIHATVEAKKLAFADRLAYLGDPEFMAVPLKELLSKEFAAGRRERIDMKRATEPVEAGALPNAVPKGDGDTSYFCVVDAQGNAASFIHSLSNYMGSGFVAGNTGILLNNRVGRGFYLEPGHPNVLAPGKRTINTIQTYMVFKDGQPFLVGGTPGGDRQPQWNVQVLSNVLDFEMNVQEAVEAARWHHFPGTDPATIGEPSELRVEAGIPSESIEGLKKRGHRVVPVGDDASGGAAQLIMIHPGTGVRMGGSDPRADGYPVAH